MALRLTAVALPTLPLLMMTVSCGGNSPIARKGPNLDSSLASLVPDDAITLGGGQVEALLKSPLATFTPGSAALMFDDFKNRYGLDPRTDLQEFLFAHNGNDGVLLVRGQFKAKELGGKLEAAGARRDEYQGKAIYMRSTEGLLFLDDRIAAVGKAPLLHEVAGRVGSSRALPAKLTALLDRIPSQGQIWFVTAGGFVLNPPAGSNLVNVDKVLSSLQDGAAWADLSKGFRMGALGTCTDAGSAKRLQTQLRGLIGLGRLSTPDDQREMLSFYDAIKIEQKDATLTLDVDVAPEMLDRLRQQVQKLSGSQ